MDKVEKPLRSLIEKWLAPTPTMSVRLIEFGRTGSNRGRYVCVEASRLSGPLSIFFFRHDDGTWRVFPPDTERAAMSVSFVCSATGISAGPSITARVPNDRSSKWLKSPNRSPSQMPRS